MIFGGRRPFDATCQISAPAPTRRKQEERLERNGSGGNRPATPSIRALKGQKSIYVI